MEFMNLRKAMLEAATSEMTTKSIRKMLLSDIGDGGLLKLEDDQGNFVMFDRDGTVEDTNFDQDREEDVEEKRILELKNNYSMVSLYFAYSFGGGQPEFVRKGDKFVQAPPKKTIKTWGDAFPNRDVDAWERKVTDNLSKIDPRMPNAWIDYDSDFGYQGVILYISKNTQEDWNDCYL